MTIKCFLELSQLDKYVMIYRKYYYKTIYTINDDYLYYYQFTIGLIRSIKIANKPSWDVHKYRRSMFSWNISRYTQISKIFFKIYKKLYPSKKYPEKYNSMSTTYAYTTYAYYG